MDRVLFYDKFGMPHIPKTAFLNLPHADRYAFANDLRVGYRLENLGEFDVVQSIEEYKGFTLIIVRYSYNLDSSNSLRMHRHCVMYKEGKSIAVSKTKKELKNLIDHNLFK